MGDGGEPRSENKNVRVVVLACLVGVEVDLVSGSVQEMKPEMLYETDLPPQVWPRLQQDTRVA